MWEEGATFDPCVRRVAPTIFGTGCGRIDFAYDQTTTLSLLKLQWKYMTDTGTKEVAPDQAGS